MQNFDFIPSDDALRRAMERCMSIRDGQEQFSGEAPDFWASWAIADSPYLKGLVLYPVRRGIPRRMPFGALTRRTGMNCTNARSVTVNSQPISRNMQEKPLKV